MIDLGQYITKTADPLRWTWAQVQGCAIKGELCVIRSSSGTPTIMKIEPQSSWKEWAGAFSAI